MESKTAEAMQIARKFAEAHTKSKRAMDAIFDLLIGTHFVTKEDTEKLTEATKVLEAIRTRSSEWEAGKYVDSISHEKTKKELGE